LLLLLLLLLLVLLLVLLGLGLKPMAAVATAVVLLLLQAVVRILLVQLLRVVGVCPMVLCRGGCLLLPNDGRWGIKLLCNAAWRLLCQPCLHLLPPVCPVAALGLDAAAAGCPNLEGWAGEGPWEIIRREP
jgi:hypothetical protein